MQEAVESGIVSDSRLRQVTISYIRACVVLLVVLEHAALVYSTIKVPRGATLAAEPRSWLMFPVDDPAGWLGFSLYFAWTELGNMPLLFFISGLFVWSSLKRRGAADFLKHRFLRLGVPFLAMALLGPTMYYPAYLQIEPHGSLAQYAQRWLSLGNWPSGPSWFIWVLLTFNCVATLIFWKFPRALESVGRFTGRLGEKPFLFFLVLVVLVEATYLPLFMLLGPYGPIMVGPFFAQGTKLLAYLSYFLVGVSVGSFGIKGGLFAPGGALARRWPLWGLAALVGFVGWMAAYAQGQDAAAAPVFAFSMASSALFLVALFVRFVSKSHPILDSFSDNAYGIYVLHYVPLTWVQFALVGVGAPAVVKCALSFACALAISWSVIALLRRNRFVRQVV